MFYMLVIRTDNAKVSFVLIALCQPGGPAINFSKSPESGISGLEKTATPGELEFFTRSI